MKQEVEPPRLCLACGYNLFGLGDEPRCPECGLLNIPSAFRQQVWDLVDSGKWFFSSFFGFARKRPPGWWWALDRPGDVRRSFKFAGCFVLLTCVLIFAAGAIADAVRIEQRWTWSTCTLWVCSDPRSIILDVEELRVYGLSGEIRRHQRQESQRKGGPSSGIQPVTPATSCVVFEPSLAFFPQCSAYVIALFWMWAGPALVGLWTQIRKGLPAFARAPRTIIAAVNYESHRLLYLTVVVVVWMILDVVYRTVIFAKIPGMFAMGENWVVLLPLLSIACAVGWIGPLRSDYTRQLIRSRKHAVRIVLMYCVLLPWIMVSITLGGIGLLIS